MALAFSLDVYKPIFLLELIIAELMFIFRMERRSYFPLRVVGSLAAGMTVAVFFPVPYYNAMWASLMFFVFFAITVGMLAFCFKGKFANILYCGIAGYSTQHIAYQLLNFIAIASGITSSPLGTYGDLRPDNIQLVFIPIGLVCYFAAYLAVFLCVCRNKTDWNEQGIKNISLLVLSGVILAIDVVNNALVTYNGYDNWNKVYQLTASGGGIICCMLTLWVMYGLIERKRIQDELDNLYHLYREQKRQYEGSISNVDLINRKCHDLKYQVRAIGESSAIKENVIAEIENVISVYDSAVKTDNRALDILLTEKSLYCQQNGIIFTCVADGSRLSFIKDVDLYVLFGNALDNAIEAVTGLPESSRVISLTTKSSGDMFSVVLQNYCSPELDIKKGSALPQTTKPDGSYHGYGLKSIRDVVERYGGDMYVTADRGVFNLNMLFFLPTGSAANAAIDTAS